jgi:iron complex outermembrane recepter protein
MGGGDRLLNSDARDNHESVGLALIRDRGSLGASYRRYDFRYGLPGEAGDEELGIKIAGLRNVVSARGELSGLSHTFPGLVVTGTAQTYTHDEIENTGAIGTSFDLKTQTGSATAKTAFGGVEGAIGVSALFKQYAATGEEALTPAADSKSGGIFLFQEIPLGKPTEHAAKLQAGARYDVFRIESKEGDPKFGPARTADFNSVSGSLGLTIPVGTSGSFALNAARAFRAPTVEELFSNAFHAASGTFDLGNPNLDAETNSGVESVFRIQTPKVNGQFSTYYNRINNFIVSDISRDTIVEGETVPLNHFSQGDATLRGAEATIEGEIVPRVVIGASGDFVRATLTGGQNVPFIPPARLGAHGRWDNGRFSLGADIRRGFKQDKVTGTDIDVPTEAYTLVNLNAGWSLLVSGRVHMLTLRADNVTDEQYRDATSWIKRFALNPGRNFALVYKVLF